MLKICGVLQRAAAQQRVDVGLEPDLQVILVDLDLVDDELQVAAVQPLLVQQVIKDLHSRFGGAIDPDDGVALVLRHGDPMVQSLNAVQEVVFQLVVGLCQRFLVFRVLHDVPDALALGSLQLLLRVQQQLLQVFGGALRLGYVLLLAGKVVVEPLQHGSGVVLHLLDIQLQQLVQPVHPDMVAGAGLQTPPVVLAAAVGVLQVGTAHGEHGAAAVAAEEKAGVGVVVDLYAPVMAGGALLTQGAGGGEGAVVDDGLMVVLEHQVVALVPLDLRAVDLPAGVFALPQRADVEIVVQYALHGDDGPRGLGGALDALALGLAALPLGHTGRGDALVGEVVGDLLVAPAVVVKLKDLPHDVCLGGDDLELLRLVDDVAVGRGAEPFAIGLAAFDDGPDLFAGVGDGHLIDEELKLDLQPVIIVGEVDVVADGDDADACVPQVFIGTKKTIISS